jgi:VWFA-related protein
MVCGGFGQTAATPEVTTFRADVSEVRLAFSATDRNGRVLAAIQPNDFAVVDQDLVVRDFRSFSRTEYTRLDVAVLLDASGSMTPRFRRELSNVVQLIAQSDSVPEECFSVISFRDLKPKLVCEGDCRNLGAQAPLSALQSGGMTPLYDTIVFASRLLARHGDLHTRKLLIVFSDGADTISLNSLTDAVASALNDDIAIYSVDVSAEPHTSPGTLVLRGLAANTGGRYFPVETGVAKVLDAVLEDFRATYTVAYKLPNYSAGFHQVRILPTHDLSLQFYCRRGYYYPSGSGN